MFEPYGAGHFGVLGLTGAVAAGLVWVGNRGRLVDLAVSGLLFAVIVACFVVDPFHHRMLGEDVLQEGLPLELCDAAGFAALVALVTRRRLAFELAYYWGLSGTFQALLTPPLDYGLAHPDTIRFFLLHGGIVVAVIYLAWGVGLRPRRGSVGRVFRYTLLYAAIVGFVDWAVGGNYMWLCSKPPGSILEWFGPWPWYLVGGAAVALFLFWLVDLPYRLGGYCLTSDTNSATSAPSRAHSESPPTSP